MNPRFAAVCAVALAMLGGAASDAFAQQVLIDVVNYNPPAGGNAANAKPGGNLNLPGDGSTYRVYVDYGSWVGGGFTKNPNMGEGPAATTYTTKVGGGGVHAWSSKDSHNLTATPPALLYARARIQKLIGTNWVDVTGNGATAVIQVTGP